MTTEQKTVLISGGAVGIGRAVTELFARRGCRVVFLYHNSRTEAQELCRQLTQEGLTVQALPCDVTDPEQAEEAVSRTVGQYGAVDVLVTNAGVAKDGLLTDFTEEEIRRLTDTNFMGTLHLVRAVYPHMVRKKRGSIVTVSSIWGEAGASCESVYAASKGAVIAFSKSMAWELAPSGVRVNCVTPGVIRTRMLDCYTERDLEQLRLQTPLGRLGTPEDVAQAVLFLAEADFITGQVLRVDGGFLGN